MSLNYLLIAQLGHQERIRAFNVRAARGEFIRYTDDKRKSAVPGWWSEPLWQLGRLIRLRFSRQGVGSLVIRPGVDSA